MQFKDAFTCNKNELSYVLEEYQKTELMSDSSDINDVDCSESDVMKVAALVDKLQHLSVHTWLQCPTHLTPALQNLGNAIDEALTDLGHFQDFDAVLPK